jgi:hypothetical protein
VRAPKSHEADAEPLGSSFPEDLYISLPEVLATVSLPTELSVSEPANPPHQLLTKKLPSPPGDRTDPEKR